MKSKLIFIMFFCLMGSVSADAQTSPNSADPALSGSLGGIPANPAPGTVTTPQVTSPPPVVTPSSPQPSPAIPGPAPSAPPVAPPVPTVPPVPSVPSVPPAQVSDGTSAAASTNPAPPTELNSNSAQQTLPNSAGPSAPGSSSTPTGSQPGVPSVALPTGSDYNMAPPVNSVVQKYNGKNIYAVVRTTIGSFTIKLFPNYAPNLVDNFLGLAKGTKEFSDARTGRSVTKPFYNGLIFHRVIRGFVVQTGCPFGNGRGGPGFVVNDEFHPALRFDKPGIVAMADQVDAKGVPLPNTAGSQFFITLAPHPEFNKKFPIFGEVVQGMNIVNKIATAKVGPTNRPVHRIVIRSIDIEIKK